MKIIGWIVALVVVLAVAGGAYYYFMMMPAGAPAPVGSVGAPQSGAEVPPPPAEPAPGPIGTQGTPDESEFRWTFEAVGSEAAPKTKVTFHYNLGNKELGTYDGACTRISETTWEPLPGEVDGAICYFAGFGTELAIFEEGAIYVAKKGVLEEGSEETGSVRGNFEVITAL